MSLTLYLAGPYAAREFLRECASELTSIGFKIGTRWLNEEHEIGAGTVGAATDLSDQQAASHAHDDLLDIDACSILVLFTAEATAAAMAGGTATSGGRHVETGYALAKAKAVVVVGQPENIFHRLTDGVTVVPDWHEAILLLSQRLVNHERQQAVPA